MIDGLRAALVLKFICVAIVFGLPITFLLTVGERLEAVVFESLMAQGSVKRPGAGRPRGATIKSSRG